LNSRGKMVTDRCQCAHFEDQMPCLRLKSRPSSHPSPFLFFVRVTPVTRSFAARTPALPAALGPWSAVRFRSSGDGSDRTFFFGEGDPQGIPLTSSCSCGVCSFGRAGVSSFTSRVPRYRTLTERSPWGPGIPPSTSARRITRLRSVVRIPHSPRRRTDDSRNRRQHIIGVPAVCSGRCPAFDWRIVPPNRR
jgi:hypothetical protein